LLPQALSTNAATKALIAILVFIYRYPRNIYGLNDVGKHGVMDLRPFVRRDFRVFRRNFIPLSPGLSGFLTAPRRVTASCEMRAFNAAIRILG
jgi:hypothetical protein